ncbi:MAG: DUF4962 domain-containing protein, partial [Armatimonadota bacterium]
WKPPEGADSFELTIARDPEMSDPVIKEAVSEPAYLPYEAFESGTYYWQWTFGEKEGEVFTFEITADAVKLEVPPASEWLQRLSDDHPRLYLSPEDVGDLRASIDNERADQWAELQSVADRLLAQDHVIEEPPYLPDRTKDYAAFFEVWQQVLWGGRKFTRGASLLALTYLASGDERYGRAACRRMDSISRWDPEGSSYLPHNDEAHMAVIWDGSKACDWCWDLFTDEERARVIEQFKRRGEITYEFMHDRGNYGVTQFGSHAGREVVFLAHLAMTFHEHIPEAVEWLEWLRPVLCGIWPVWAEDDGAWAEGPSYGNAYVNIMTMFATALKRGCDVNLYRRPFWSGHARWRKWCEPPYAEWIGFGDHTEVWATSWEGTANLVDIIRHEGSADGFGGYVRQLRQRAKNLSTPDTRDLPRFSPQLFTAAPIKKDETDLNEDHIQEVFEDAGWAAVRTDFENADNDIAMIFRSSPYGSYSHSHANHNDFIIHVGGRVMTMPAGYYNGYGSPHHANYVWHTKSHNCLTLSDAGQIMRKYKARGVIESAFEDDTLTYMVGNADLAYAGAIKCRRHVLFLKRHSCFVLIDDVLPEPDQPSTLQFNMHSWASFGVDEPNRSFALMRGGSRLHGHFMYHRNSSFILTEGWDPPPAPNKPNKQWKMQYHMRFMPGTPGTDRQILGTILCAGHDGLIPAEVRTELADDTEVADIGGDTLLLNQGSGIDWQDIQTPALAVFMSPAGRYIITDTGVEIG